MSTITFAGQTLDHFLPHPTAAETTLAGRFSSRVNNAISVDVSSPLLSPVFSSLTSGWVHWWIYSASSSVANNVLATLYDSSGVARIRIRVTASSTFQTEWWNGSAWASVGSTFSVGTGALHQIDVRFDINGALSTIEVYVDRAQVAAAVANYSAIVNIAQVGRTSSANVGTQQISELIVCADSTLLKNLYWNTPTGNSATNTGFSGDYTAVDELVLDRGDFVYSTSAGDVETYTAAARSITEPTIDCAIVTAEALKSASGPQSLQLVWRKGGTNYFSGTKALTYGFGSVSEYAHVDPSTAAAWAVSAVNAATLEFGVKSIA